MGCFNKTGFFSHLPITYGDEIVMFVCADSYSRSCTRGNTPISIVGTGMTPIAPPFFGEYDDYGAIENVVDDVNHQLFTKIFGMTLEEFCDVMHDLAGVTIGDVKERLAELKNGEKPTNNYHHETIEDYEKLLSLFENVFGHEPVMRKYEDNNEHSEELRKVYASMHDYEVKKYNGTCFMLCMEHKSVYDKMVAVGREHYFDYWIGYKDEKKVTPEEAFDNTTESMMKLSEFSEEYMGNPFKFGLGTETIDFIDMLSSKLENRENSTEEQLEQLKTQSKLLDLLNFSRDIMKMREHFGIKACMHDTVYTDKTDFALYNNMMGDITAFKDIACNFVYFIESMRRTCTTFEPSPYHNQTVCYETVIPIFEEILATLKRKAKKYGEE